MTSIRDFNTENVITRQTVNTYIYIAIGSSYTLPVQL